ncbi:deoxyuridine 5'triphosphate nucleotidohydrolase [Nosema bombycis CQ1]|uniref:Deoxyuridine 5'triphosphate nucleotidohydrolase n=1 Tax=Nosema bombycis (strain CQ1 / CVCC 102059) TaxID=578461 RepID=R0KYD3_NOSB1|nr:deoxyuridine 5'triphosphate nucleotidohydrolase [Nosema bombycis CQ1]|eukprot:EOB15227.1 deoxyuridine 5'triphosphate nucleotidohydrolase [Nosema bombycis CQ1]
MEVKIEVLEGGRKPVYENGIYKCFVSQDTEIQPKSGGLVPMGVKIKVPNTHFINVRGTMFRTLGGVGDSDYRGPMYFIVYNNTCEPMIFKQGDQAGHFVIVKIRTPPLELLN